MWYVYEKWNSRAKPRSSGGFTSANPQVLALIPRPAFNWMERMCQRQGSNKKPHPPALVKHHNVIFIYYHISSRGVVVSINHIIWWKFDGHHLGEVWVRIPHSWMKYDRSVQQNVYLYTVILTTKGHMHWVIHESSSSHIILIFMYHIDKNHCTNYRGLFQGRSVSKSYICTPPME